MKYLLLALLLSGCESKLAECISLSAVVSRVNSEGFYCWVHTNGTPYCIRKAPVLEAAP